MLKRKRKYSTAQGVRSVGDGWYRILVTIEVGGETRGPVSALGF
jgi:hypothetical protein